MELLETDLLQGAVYALEQAGHLLRDAYLLFLRERYSSSLVLAIFSKEEMGRFEMLLDDWEAVASKKAKATTESVLRRCDDHLAKLRNSHYEDDVDLDFIGRPELTMAILKGPWGSKEHKDAIKKARDLNQRLARRMPDELHRKRLRALYVEPSGNGKEWNRPVQTTREDCLRLLVKASDEYDARCSWYEVNERETSSWVSQWAERPELPKSISVELWRFR